MLFGTTGRKSLGSKWFRAEWTGQSGSFEPRHLPLRRVLFFFLILAGDLT